MRSRVLVVDHDSSIWNNLNGDPESSQYELSLVDDGMEAFMVCSNNQFDTVLIRKDLPGVTGQELAREITRKHPQVNVALFGNHPADESTTDPSSSSFLQIQSSPSTQQEATHLLQQAVSQPSTAGVTV